ncbi:MAG: hypothetical protein JW895_17900 [Thermoleophilaceae bacterium]|nr:hypothetical protein [Thermoleophilaceae bacterium]
MRKYRSLAAAFAVASLCLAPADASADFSLLGSFGLSNPPGGATGTDIAVDRAGNVYALRGTWIQKYDPMGVLITTFGGPATFPEPGPYPEPPSDVAVDGSGDVYVAHPPTNRVIKFAPDGTVLARLGRNGGDGTAGNGPGEFDHPTNVALDAQGNLFVRDQPAFRLEAPDTPSPRIQKLSPAGVQLASVEELQAGELAVTATGDLVQRQFSYWTQIVRRDAATLAVVDRFTLPRSSPEPPPRSYELDSCCGVAVVGDTLWVGRDSGHQVEQYALDGRLLYACGTVEPPGFEYRAGAIAAGPRNTLYTVQDDLVQVMGDGPTPCDSQRPRIGRAGLSKTRFRASSWRTLRRIYVYYTLSEQATVSARLLQRRSGRLVRGICRRPSRSNRGRRACARPPRTRARLSGLPGYPQPNGYPLVRGLWRSAPPPGRYFLILIATDRSGKRSDAVVLRLRLLR